jgi:hypothetical protein
MKLNGMACVLMWFDEAENLENGTIFTDWVEANELYDSERQRLLLNAGTIESTAIDEDEFDRTWLNYSAEMVPTIEMYVFDLDPKEVDMGVIE